MRISTPDLLKFRTNIPLSPSNIQLNHNSRILSLGSCFAVNMGDRLAESRFETRINPLGIVYNPFSLHRLLSKARTGEPPKVQFAEASGLWHSFDLHSQVSSPDREVVERQISEGFQTIRTALQQGDVLLLTLGTAMTYRLRESGEVVSNCHKYPGHLFEKELLSLDELLRLWHNLLTQLTADNPQLRILLTVSPVRHVKDTLPLNSVSKSTLRLLCHSLAQSHEAVEYFPAFEIMVDDLRDYRYYTDDLLHPTPFAQQYIWEHFQAAHMAEETRALISRWQHIQKQLDHRPLQPRTKSHQKFLEKLLNQLEEINRKLPCTAQLTDVRQRLSDLKAPKPDR